MWTETRHLAAGALALVLSLALVPSPAAAASDGPLSAIDWLSRGLDAPDPGAGPAPDEPPVTDDATTGRIEVTPLGRPSPDAVGLLPVSVTGLPRDLWGRSVQGDLAERLKGFEPGMLPAMRRLLFVLLLAELDPPAAEDPAAPLFLARVDTLMRFGAVDEAQALMERAGADRPQIAARLFDAALLTGTEDRVCALLRRSPDLSPGFAARIFCLARGGDWDAAALTLETGRALGHVGVYEDAFLTRFLDPETFEGLPALPPPPDPTPLVFRLAEAIGEPLPTSGLPLAFAQADLRGTAGWRAEIAAAERLARSGALPANRLLGLWTARKPAASGGIWDRVAAVQRLDRAVEARDLAALADTLPAAWAEVSPAGLEPVLAELYAARLEHLLLPAEDAEVARFRLGLLSERYESFARARAPRDATEEVLAALAQGRVPDGPPPDDLFAAAAVAGFRAAGAPARLKGLIEGGRLGEAILRAIRLVEAGADGDTGALGDGLALLRAVGLEGVARRAALEVLILDRRG